jgi:hypothetical protein
MKSKKHGKRLCYDCGMYGHEGALCLYKSWTDKCEVTKQIASNKVAKQNIVPMACLKCKNMGNSTNSCILGIKDVDARKEAQI